MGEEYEVKRKISRLSSRLYGDIRTICGTEGLTQSRLENLIQVVTLDRIKLAISFYDCAKKLDAQSDKQDGDYRSIISRGYYCHYHFARAAIFFITRDDIEDAENQRSACLRLSEANTKNYLRTWEKFYHWNTLSLSTN